MLILRRAACNPASYRKTIDFESLNPSDRFSELPETDVTESEDILVKSLRHLMSVLKRVYFPQQMNTVDPAQ